MFISGLIDSMGFRYEIEGVCTCRGYGNEDMCVGHPFCGGPTRAPKSLRYRRILANERERSWKVRISNYLCGQELLR